MLFSLLVSVVFFHKIFLQVYIQEVGECTSPILSLLHPFVMIWNKKLSAESDIWFKGALAYRVSSFPKYFVFASLCSFICLQAVYQLSGPVCKATWNGCPSYSASYLHFTLCD